MFDSKQYLKEAFALKKLVFLMQIKWTKVGIVK